jgi:hypothetical protein
MALNPKYSNAAVNAEGDALSDLLDNGYLRIFDGAQPTNADTAVGAQTLLAELRFNATASGATVAGVITFSAFTADSSINATGTAAWFRALKADGTTAVFDGTVGTGTHDLVVSTTAFVSGAQASVTSFTHTLSKG